MKNQDLFNAIIDNNVLSVEQLIQQGVDVNACDVNGYSAWFCAVKANHYAISLLLHRHGAEMNEKDKEEMKQIQIKKYGQPPSYNEVMKEVNTERTVVDKAAKLQRFFFSHYPFMIKTPQDKFFAEEFKKDESSYRAEFERLCNERDSVSYPAEFRISGCVSRDALGNVAQVKNKITNKK